jgi:3-(3-hydroxy-phenyl)propionate hydroxylase
VNKKNFTEVHYKNTKINKINSVKSKYIIGCDGANSFIRNEMKTELENLGFEQRWAVIDLILKTKNVNLPDRTIQYCNAKRPATYCRNVGRRRRWEIALKDNESSKTFFDEKRLWKFLSKWVTPDEVEIERKTVYTFQSAIAKSWREGRMFLVGDAAHLTPPFMGQGMCAGIRDASNLAWKISICCKKGHSENLLNSYQSERSSNVRDYINTAMKMGELLNSIGGSEVSDTVFVQPDGTIKMNTIKPQLGKGLGECEDINRGKIFPSFKSDFGRDIDNIFACDPILITNKKINKKELRIKSYDCSDIPGMEVILKKFKTNTLIIRPDRFILASTQKNDLLKFTNTCLNQIYSL